MTFSISTTLEKYGNRSAVAATATKLKVMQLTTTIINLLPKAAMPLNTSSLTCIAYKNIAYQPVAYTQTHRSRSSTIDDKEPLHNGRQVRHDI